jgi:exodeoxyribonuclease V alpha subunit
VGDPDQLPPVGPGAPLRAAIESGLLPRVDLRQIFRQSSGSAIVRSAHAINQGGCGALGGLCVCVWGG